MRFPLGKPVVVGDLYTGCVLKEDGEKILVSFNAEGVNMKAWFYASDVKVEENDKAINGGTPKDT